MTLEQWAIRWGIPYQALHELRGLFNMDFPPPPVKDGWTEAAVMSRVRLEAAQKGVRLWRNNVGACTTDTGSFIRFGLANESKEMNKKIKSSDLIGGRPVLITADMIGFTICQLVARECKEAGWTFTGTEEEIAQLAFLKQVAAMGGDAKFCNDVGTI